MSFCFFPSLLWIQSLVLLASLCLKRTKGRRSFSLRRHARACLHSTSNEFELEISRVYSWQKHMQYSAKKGVLKRFPKRKKNFNTSWTRAHNLAHVRQAPKPLTYLLHHIVTAIFCLIRTCTNGLRWVFACGLHAVYRKNSSEFWSTRLPSAALGRLTIARTNFSKAPLLSSMISAYVTPRTLRNAQRFESTMRDIKWNADRQTAFHSYRLVLTM